MSYASETALWASGLAAVQALLRGCISWFVSLHGRDILPEPFKVSSLTETKQSVLHEKHSVHLQAEGDEVAAKLLATRRETMRLRNKIKELKQQHAELRQMKEAQQQQLLASTETPEGQSAQKDSGDQIQAQEQQCTSELSEKIASDLEAMSCETASDVSEQSSAEL
jgi:chromosome segregation ATPase